MSQFVIFYLLKPTISKFCDMLSTEDSNVTICDMLSTEDSNVIICGSYLLKTAMSQFVICYLQKIVMS